MAKSSTTIFHNPSCGTSRNVLTMIREAGIEPEVVEYVKAGWSAGQLKDLFQSMGVNPAEALRVRGTQAEALGLTDPSVSDAKIISAMVADPILVNRPIVVTPRGASLCRPVELLLPLLPDEARQMLKNKAIAAPAEQAPAVTSGSE